MFEDFNAEHECNSTPLEHLLKRYIRRHGRISIGDFMQIALGHRRWGYYNRQGRQGRHGIGYDFATAPEISSLFGILLGLWCVEQWHRLGRPADWALVELGPGRGTLIVDILAQLVAAGTAPTIVLIENSSALRAQQQAKIRAARPDYPNEIHWKSSKGQFASDTVLPTMPTVVVANEFFDCMPVELVRFRKASKQGIYEQCMVGAEAGRLVTRYSEVSPEAALENVAAHFAGDREAQASALAWLHGAGEGKSMECRGVDGQMARNLAQHVRKQGGSMLIIDYGYNTQFEQTPSEMAELGSIQAMYKGEYSDIFSRVGHADITAHVDMKAIESILKVYGDTWAGTQAQFLVDLGIFLLLEKAMRNLSQSQAEQITQNVHQLISTDQMGALFKVVTLAADQVKSNQ